MEIMTLLVVEDDDLDYMALQRELLKQGWAPQVVRAHDGIEAFEQLELAAKYGPCLVVLDLSLPRVSGLQFLENVRSRPEYKSLPIFVLTSCENSRDLNQTYAHGISGYIVKQDVGSGFSKIVQMIRLYTEVVNLPPAWVPQS